MSATTRATLIGVVAILLWAVLALFTASAGSIPPFEKMVLSFSVAFVSGMILLAMRGRAALARLKQGRGAWLTAFIGIFGYHALYFYALLNAPVAEASLIAYLWPLFIVLFSALLPGAGLKTRHLLGALLGFLGTALIILKPGAGSDFASAWPGYLAAFGCALTWSGYSVLNRRFEGTPTEMIVGVCGAIALAAIPFHLAFESWMWPTTGQWLSLLALGLGPVGLAFLAWDHATKQGNLSLLGALSYLSPFVSTALLVVTGATAASWQLALSALLVIGGSLIATGLFARKAAA